MNNNKSFNRSINAVLVVMLVVIIGLIGFVFIISSGFIPESNTFAKSLEGDTRIACIGDSITYGTGVFMFGKNSYPSKLDYLLGDGYCVNNFGHPGAAVSPNSDLFYGDTKEFKDSIEFEPNIIIFMLGTNDSRDANWKSIEHFSEAYKSLLGTYKNLESVSDIYIVTPLPNFNFLGKTWYNINGNIIKDNIIPFLKEFSIKEEITLIDAYSEFENKSNLFWDGTHPNNDGAEELAKIVYNVIKA